MPCRALAKPFFPCWLPLSARWIGSVIWLGRVDNFNPKPCGCNTSHGDERSGGFLVTRSDATELLEAIDAALDEVASFVGFAIIFDWRFPVRSRRNNRFDASVDQVAANVIAVVALVAEEFTGIGIMQPPERVIAFDLVRLAAGDIEGQRVAFGVRAEVDFGREAAARAPERFLILIPPFTPAACWCARTIVESMACSSSGHQPCAFEKNIRGDFNAASEYS